MNDISKPRFYEAVPVFLVGDIATTMKWYSSKLGFNARAVPESPTSSSAIRADRIRRPRS